MGIRERRDIEKADMKKKIMDAVIDLIEQEGYEKLSIRKIAAKIEYSPTTIYLYYKDKAEIIADMARELYHKVERDAVTIIDNTAADPIDKLAAGILRGVVRSLCSEPEMARAIMYSGSGAIFENEHDVPSNTGIAQLDRIFDEGIAQNIFKSNIRNTSWMMISALLGFVMCSIENKLYQRDDFELLADTFVELLMGGIKK